MEMNYKYFKLTKIGEKYSIDSKSNFLGHLEKEKDKYVFVPNQYEKLDTKQIIWFQDCISDLNKILIELNS